MARQEGDVCVFHHIDNDIMGWNISMGVGKGWL